jgi:hypothetical protein
MLVSRPVFLSKWLRTISEASGNWWRFYEATCLADFFDYWGRLWLMSRHRYTLFRLDATGLRAWLERSLPDQMGHSVEAAFIIYYMFTTSYFIRS